MGSIVSLVAYGTIAAVGATLAVIETIALVLTTVLIACADLLLGLLCCRCTAAHGSLRRRGTSLGLGVARERARRGGPVDEKAGDRDRTRAA